MAYKNDYLSTYKIDSLKPKSLKLLSEISLYNFCVTSEWFKKGYDPNEPRVPAGQTGGGQWTSGGPGVPTHHSPKQTIINNADGSSEIRQGGSLAWRNNNPGNIKAGKFANQHGAIGSNGEFAVFP